MGGGSGTWRRRWAARVLLLALLYLLALLLLLQRPFPLLRCLLSLLHALLVAGRTREWFLRLPRCSGSIDTWPRLRCRRLLLQLLFPLLRCLLRLLLALLVAGSTREWYLRLNRCGGSLSSWLRFRLRRLLLLLLFLLLRLLLALLVAGGAREQFARLAPGGGSRGSWPRRRQQYLLLLLTLLRGLHPVSRRLLPLGRCLCGIRGPAGPPAFVAVGQHVLQPGRRLLVVLLYRLLLLLIWLLALLLLLLWLLFLLLLLWRLSLVRHLLLHRRLRLRGPGRGVRQLPRGTSVRGIRRAAWCRGLSCAAGGRMRLLNGMPNWILTDAGSTWVGHHGATAAATFRLLAGGLGPGSEWYRLPNSRTRTLGLFRPGRSCLLDGGSRGG